MASYGNLAAPSFKDDATDRLDIEKPPHPSQTVDSDGNKGRKLCTTVEKQQLRQMCDGCLNVSTSLYRFRYPSLDIACPCYQHATSSNRINRTYATCYQKAADQAHDIKLVGAGLERKEITTYGEVVLSRTRPLIVRTSRQLQPHD